MPTINQSRGPRTGNQGRPSKRSAFIADKKSKEATAREITSRIGERASGVDVPKTNRQARQGSISPSTNKGRGPTRGNK